MKSSKKQSNFLTFYLILMITVGILGLVCVWLADSKTLFRPEEWDNENFMLTLMGMFGIGRQDITITSMILVAAIYFSVVLGSVIFFLTLRVKRALKEKGKRFWSWV